MGLSSYLVKVAYFQFMELADGVFIQNKVESMAKRNIL
jgi:hypothetical protein